MEKDMNKTNNNIINIEIIKEQINEILKRNKFKEFKFEKVNRKTKEFTEMTATVYFFNNEDYEAIVRIEKIVELTNQVVVENTKKTKSSLYNVVSILGRNKFVYRTLGFILKHKYKLILGKEKCLKQLPIEFEISNNIALKKHNSFLKDFVTDEKEKDRLNTEMASNLESKKEEFEEILGHPEEYDILITSFKDEMVYPHLYCNLLNTETNKKEREYLYLRIDVPNIVNFDPSIGEGPEEMRPNAKVRKFLIDGKNIFGNVYIKKRVKKLQKFPLIKNK